MKRLLSLFAAMLLCCAAFADVVVLKASTMDKQMNVIVKATSDGGYVYRIYDNTQYSPWYVMGAIRRKYVEGTPVVELSDKDWYLVWIMHFPKGYKALSYLYDEDKQDYDIILLDITYLHIAWFKEVMSY